MRCSTMQKMPVAILGHPAGARQVRGPDSLGLLRIVRRIEMQNDPRDLPPIGGLPHRHREGANR